MADRDAHEIAREIVRKFMWAAFEPNDLPHSDEQGAFEAIAAAIMAERPQWRPIEEAPKDGKDAFLLLTNTHVVWTGHWSRTDKLWVSIDGQYLGVSHFMPLPTPPGETPARRALGGEDANPTDTGGEDG